MVTLFVLETALSQGIPIQLQIGTWSNRMNTCKFTFCYQIRKDFTNVAINSHKSTNASGYNFITDLQLVEKLPQWNFHCWLQLTKVSALIDIKLIVTVLVASGQDLSLDFVRF